LLTVRKILIIGAGQAGLQLALSLQAEGYDVTVMSARTAEEIRGGWPTSTQGMFWPALDREREYKLNLWEDQVPPLEGIGVSLAPAAGQRAFSFWAPWDRPGNSVDQRVKMAGWLELFESRDGRVIYHPVMTSDLAGLVPMYDLTIIAAGKGELVELFDRDGRKSRYDKPQRILSAIYLDGVQVPADSPETKVRINIQPGVGETFSIPALTITGPCDILLMEAVPGGPFDRFSDRPDPAEHLRRLTDLLVEHFPWEGELYAHAAPTDPRASLTGAFTPTIRHPAAEVAPGTYVLGMADVVTVNDPIAGQGANNAAHAAGIYLRSILDRGDAPFDREWMQQTFDKFWDHVRHSVALSEVLLEPMPPHAQQILGAAAQYPQIAKRFADLFPLPQDLENWVLDPQKAAEYLAEVTAG
jgi:hypothetical protein